MDLNRETSMVLSAVAICIMTIIGLMLFGAFVGVDVDKNVADTFIVTDTGTDKDCTLNYYPSNDGDLTVRYYDGASWSDLALTTDYTISGNVVTVKASAMD